MGDYVCEVTFNKDIKFAWWYGLYGRLMLLSYKLDKHEEVWNLPNNNMVMHRHFENEQIHQI